MTRTSTFMVSGLLLLLTGTNVHAQLYDLPFLAENFDVGDLKVFWGRDKHSDSGSVQEHGYDLGAVRYDRGAEKWTEFTVSDAEYNRSRTNQRWLIYGKNIHAMREGKVIACWRNAPENPPGGLHQQVNNGRVYGGGNGFWIEHADGTRIEYAHMIPDSVPRDLCPHNAVLLPQKISSPLVAKAWPHIRVPAEKQATVKAGQFLGRVGNSGTSSSPHLHIHLEQGGEAGLAKKDGSPLQINFRRGLFAQRNNGSPNNVWKSFAGKPIPAGPVLVWPHRSLSSEYARHRFPADQFQELFDHLTDSGYWLVWADTYNVGGKNFINQIWRPAKRQWRAHVLVNSQSHQNSTSAAMRAGFAPVFVESSVSGGQARYSAVFVKGMSSNVIMRHGLTVQQHSAEIAAANKKGLSPAGISVISIGGQRRYTVLYRPEKVGAWEIRSQIPETGYQAMYDANVRAGRRPIYLNAYMHGGQPFISAIFASRPGGKDRHLMSASTYQQEWRSALEAEMLTRAVTSFDGARSQHRFAAVWWE